jgi:hypothetical protein
VYLGGLKREVNAVELWDWIPPICSAHCVSLKPTIVADFADAKYVAFPAEERCWEFCVPLLVYTLSNLFNLYNSQNEV